jgi:hypothetical protein
MIFNTTFNTTFNTKNTHFRQFSSSIIYMVEDQDLDLSDQKNKHKASETENKPAQELLESGFTARWERGKQLYDMLGPGSEYTIQQILYDEFGPEGPEPEYDYIPEPNEGAEIANRRNRFDNYTPEQQTMLEKAKEEYNNIINDPDSEKLLSDKMKDISLETSATLEEINENPLNNDAYIKADLLGDLFEVYKYGSDKFDADRGLNEYEHKLDKDNKKDSNDSDSSEKGGGSNIGPSNPDIGEGPSNSSGGAQRIIFTFQEKFLIIFSSLAASMENVLDILLNAPT